MKNFKKGMSLFLAGVMSLSSVSTMSYVNVLATEPTYIYDVDLSTTEVAAPSKDDVVPNANQYEYMKQELAAFCHFGPNTFNEIEWGERYGDKAPDEIFKLEKDFDEDKMVKAIKDAGFKKIIVTAKHHDGFCIWDSAYTEYDVAATSYKDANGNSDILAEISAACTKYDIDMGLYLSPWDIHDDSYGYYDANGNATSKDKDVLDYNDYYNNQLEEILGNDKYGNNGHFNEVWMDGAKGSGANAQDYDFNRWFSTIQKHEGKEAGYDADCMLFGAEAYTTVRWIGNEHGYANEETWAKSTVDYDKNTINSYRNSEGYYMGSENGNQWTVPECDARITSGWFWGNYKKTPKTVEALGEMYFRSVGLNSTFLLNIPPNDQGSIDDAILERVAEFGDAVKGTFATNLAKDATVGASEVRGNSTTYAPSNVLDGNDDTYWTVNDGTTEASMIIELDKTKTFDVVSIEEAIQFGQRIKEHKIEYRTEGGEWKVFSEGTTIGSKRLARKGAVKADELRLTFTTTSQVPMISEVGVYKASEGFELSSGAPEGMKVLDINDASAFTLSSGWTKETGSQYINGTNAWANPGNTLTLKFTGSKVYLLGTLDSGHGTATVSIDGGTPVTIDTNSSSRSVGQVIFTSENLENKEHTLVLTTVNKAIGCEAAYVIDNQAGMVGFEESKYTMDENETIQVKLIRHSGEGEVSVTVNPNPGTAIQDDYNTELNTVVTFKDGETEKLVPVQTRRNTKETGKQYFTIELVSDNEDLILGFNAKARINIIDAESYASELANIIEECSTLNQDNYTMLSWQNLQAKVAEGQTLLENDAEFTELKAAIKAIEEAKAALAEKADELLFSVTSPYLFPSEVEEKNTLEAEFSILENSGAADEKWKLSIGEATWASNEKFVNCLNKGDKIRIPYLAKVAGTYEFEATFRSGSNTNALKWSEVNNKITAGQQSAGHNDASVTKTVKFNIVVEKAGAGILEFAPVGFDSPQLDKFDVTLKQLSETEVINGKELDNSKVEVVAGNQQNEDEGASKVIDGNTSTKWHTNWYPTGDDMSDHYLVFTFDELTEINGFKMMQRQDNSPNGVISKFDLFVREDSTSEWIKVVHEGTLTNVKTFQTVNFAPVNAKEVKFQVLEAGSDQNGKAFSSVTEMQFLTTEEQGEPVVPSVNKDALNAKIAEVENIKADAYTEESFAAFAKALEAAKVVAEKEDVTQDDINEALTALEEAYEGLKEIEKPVEKPFPFTDVSNKQWYYGVINEAYQLGLMTGATDTLFKPNANMNRGMVAIVFHRMEGSKKVEYSSIFPDVANKQYYTTSVLWAKQAGVINGYTDGTFKPLRNVSREEMATMIYNFARYKGLDMSASKDITYFSDYAKITPYARVTLQWAVEKGLMSGKDNGTRLDPLGTATRAECSKMLVQAYKVIYK